MEIQTKRLHLVPLGIQYLESAHHYMSDLENTRYMIHMPKKERSETQAFIRQIAEEWEKQSPDFYEFAVLLDGQHIGYFQSVKGIKHFMAHCDSENVASQKVMGKLGFTLVEEYGGRKNRGSEEE